MNKFQKMIGMMMVAVVFGSTVLADAGTIQGREAGTIQGFAGTIQGFAGTIQGFVEYLFAAIA